jgi:hypothetical protein
MVVAADAVGWYIIDKHFPEKKTSVVACFLCLFMNNEGATKNATYGIQMLSGRGGS